MTSDEIFVKLYNRHTCFNMYILYRILSRLLAILIKNKLIDESDVNYIITDRFGL